MKISDITDISALRKEVQKEYINKGYSGEKLDSALMNDPRYPKDRIIEVTGYDLENHKILGMLGNKKCEVKICPASFKKTEELMNARQPNIKEGAWFGHKIDESMVKANSVGSQLILQESIVEKTKDGVNILSSKVIGVAPANKNTFAGLFAPSTPIIENPKVTKVQHWEPNLGGSSNAVVENHENNISKPKMK